MRIAFLGLGIMGKPMAQNLVKAGHELKVWNRSPGKTVDGAHSASTPREAAKDAEIVWLCVSDTKAVEEVLLGENGVIESLKPTQSSSTPAPSCPMRALNLPRK